MRTFPYLVRGHDDDIDNLTGAGPTRLPRPCSDLLDNR